MGFKKLIKSHSVPACVIRCVSVIGVVVAILSVFGIESRGYGDDAFDVYGVFEWVVTLFVTLLLAIVNYGVAIIIDAAYIYTKKNAPQEDVDYDYNYTPSASSSIISEDSTAEENNSLYDDIINNG